MEYAAPQAACSGTSDDSPCAQALAAPTSVAAGRSHTCAVIGGNVWCWGNNGSGQASVSGDPTIHFPKPVCVTPGAGCTPLAAVAVAAGDTFTCALLTDGGGVKCWGSGSSGELGNGTTTYNSTPPGDVCASGTGPCVALTGVKAIYAGASTACAVMHAGSGALEGEVRCWGYGSYGQLGDGGATSSSVPTKVCATGAWDGATCAGPGGAPLTGVTSVGVGYYHVCAVAPIAGGTNAVYCWGDGSSGQLGTTVTSTQRNPKPVCNGAYAADCTATPLGGVGTGTAALGAGYSHSCVVTGTGGVVCWGQNTGGQLGNGTTTDLTTPVAVCTSGTSNGPGGCTGATLSGATALAIGDTYGCARLADGKVRCWGADSSSRLGRGAGAATSTLASPVCSSGADATCVALANVTAVAAAQGDHTCAVTATGLVCWGYNANAELGIGALDLQLRPAPVCATGSGTSCNPLSGVTQVAAGWARACARMSDGTARCWGNDFSDPQLPGYLPNPTPLCADAATPVCASLNTIVQLALQSDFGCAVLASGQVRCFGNGDYGQLGDNVITSAGQANSTVVPTTVCSSGSGTGCIPFAGVVQLAAGVSTMCALDEAGQAWCWGDNGKGQLGDGDTTSAFAGVPKKVCAKGDPTHCEAPPPFVALAGGSTHFCGLTGDGRVYCWGDNELSQIGDGHPGFSGDVRVTATPVCASGAGTTCVPLAGVTAVSAGDGVTCALLADGTARCWGYQGYLGDGGGATGENPAPVCAPDAANTCATAGGCTAGTLDHAVAIDAGGWMSCALRDDGGLWCWGQQTSAHLANGRADSALRCLPVEACATGAGDGCAGGTVLTDAATLTCNQLEVTSP